MFLCLSIKTDSKDVIQDEIRIAQVSKHLKPVEYQKTVDLIHLHIDKLNGVIIPVQISGADYSVEYLIDHIRLDIDPKVSQLPIEICVKSAIEFDAAVEMFLPSQWKLFEEIGVHLVLIESIGEEISKTDINPKSLSNYLSNIANEPHFGSGSHDRSNTWGSFSLLLAVNRATGQFTNELEALRIELIEDTYYKKKLSKFTTHEINPGFKKRVIDERASLAKLIESQAGAEFKVLVVEDELENGWQLAYNAALASISTRIKLIFAKDIDSAKSLINSSFNLILLDVRLDKDRHEADDLFDPSKVSDLSGVRLAKSFHELYPWIPIVAATASNKAWTLEALLNHGISAYWIKSSPDSSTCLNHALENLIFFYTQINRVLKWSLEIGPVIVQAYRIVNLVSKDRYELRKELRQKAQSLHAIFHRPFNAFIRELDPEIQSNTGFLTAYSMLNEIILFSAKPEKFGPDTKLIFETNDRVRHELAVITERNKFPEGEAMKELLGVLDLGSEQAKFETLRFIRNNLTLTHGKVEQLSGVGHSKKSASIENTKQIIDIYIVLMNKLINY